MARIAGLKAVGNPHHITQRGNRLQKTFFCDEDYVVAYVELAAQWCQKYNVEIWAWGGLLTTVRYIEMNLVAAKLVQRPEDYPWSSAQAHLKAEDDQLVKVAPLLLFIPDWSGFLDLSSDEEIE